MTSHHLPTSPTPLSFACCSFLKSHSVFQPPSIASSSPPTNDDACEPLVPARPASGKQAAHVCVARISGVNATPMRASLFPDLAADPHNMPADCPHRVAGIMTCAQTRHGHVSLGGAFHSLLIEGCSARALPVDSRFRFLFDQELDRGTVCGGRCRAPGWARRPARRRTWARRGGEGHTSGTSGTLGTLYGQGYGSRGETAAAVQPGSTFLNGLRMKRRRSGWIFKK